MGAEKKIFSGKRGHWVIRPMCSLWDCNFGHHELKRRAVRKPQVTNGGYKQDMSYLEIYAVEPGKPTILETLAEFRNAHGGASLLWSDIHEKYMGLPRYDWLMKDDPLLWESMEEACPPRLKFVLMLTYDMAYLLKEDYGWMFSDINDYLGEMGYTPKGVFTCKYVNHWPAIRDVIEKATCPALGFYWTSCGENAWREYGCDCQGDAPLLPIDWSTRFDVYTEAKNNLDEQRRRGEAHRQDGVG